MARKLSGTFDGKLQTVAKVAVVSVCTTDRRYSGMTSHIGCLAAMIIAGSDRDLSVCGDKSRLGR